MKKINLPMDMRSNQDEDERARTVDDKTKNDEIRKTTGDGFRWE
jgi:hypothetical protein